jgi:4-amino-4-deoxy-L-arabinose transferase-like glycosyltransferase
MAVQASHGGAARLEPTAAGAPRPTWAAIPVRWQAIWQGPMLDWGLAAIATVLGGWLRWSGLSRQSLWVDEMSSFGMANTGMRRIIDVVLAFDGHPPLYIFLVHIAHFNFGLGTVDSVRVPSLIAGIASIGVVYALARLLVGRLAAILATTLVVVSPPIVWYSREGRMYAVTWLFVMLSFLALTLAVRSRRWPWLVLYTGFVALSLYSDISAVMALVPQAAVIGWFYLRANTGERSLWLRAGAAYAAGWVLFIPWLAVLPRQLPLLHGTFSGYEPSLGSAWQLALNLAGLDASYANLYRLQVPLILAALVLMGYFAAIAGAIILGREHRLFTATALGLTLGPAVMCAAFLVAGSPGVLLPRVMGITAFGLALTAGGTAALAWHVLKPSRVGVAVLGTAVVLVIGGTALSLRNVEARGYNGQDWRRVADVLTQRAEPGDALIYFPYGLKIMVDAYLPPGSHWIKHSVGLWAAPHAVAQANFTTWAAGHPHVWVVYYAAGQIDMPVHDAWFRDHGYVRIAGDPQAGAGLLEYVPSAGP